MDAAGNEPGSAVRPRPARPPDRRRAAADRRLASRSRLPHGYGHEGAALLSVRAPNSSYSEHNNLWYGNTTMPFYWNGSGRTFSAYRNASRQGQADLTRDPMLGPNFALAAGSPALDAGSTAVDRSLEYRALCDGRPFSYCGQVPDFGAAESSGQR